MKRIFVMRHGLTEMNKLGLINGWIDDKLTPEGIEQAKNARSSVPSSVKRIYSSSLARAAQTADTVNAELKLPISYHDELKEVNFGDLSGTPFLEKYKIRHKILSYDWRPSGESLEDVKKRVIKILRVIDSENGDGEALIVAHGGIVRLLNFLEKGENMGDIDNASLYIFDLDKILANN